MIRSLATTASLAFVSSVVLSAQAGPHEVRARDIFKQLVEINTTESVGTTQAAEAMAARFRAAGFPDADLRVFEPNARKGNLVVRYRVTEARRPLLLLAHLDVVEAKREDWTATRGGRKGWREFHDRFLTYGGPPIPMVRQQMMGSSERCRSYAFSPDGPRTRMMADAIRRHSLSSCTSSFLPRRVRV